MALMIWSGEEAYPGDQMLPSRHSSAGWGIGHIGGSLEMASGADKRCGSCPGGYEPPKYLDSKPILEQTIQIAVLQGDVSVQIDKRVLKV